jgi:hypothetical protein
MWFSGLRGAIAFSLSRMSHTFCLYSFINTPSIVTLPSPNQNAIVTTTLVICLVSMVFLGGGTLPLLNYLYGRDIASRKSPHTQLRVEDDTETFFNMFDEKYMRPFFCNTTSTTTTNTTAKRKKSEAVRNQAVSTNDMVTIELMNGDNDDDEDD